MKLQLLYPVLLLLAMTACNKDDNPPGDNNLLHYDGENASGPLLAAGNHELAIRFPAALLSQYSGKTIESVEFFVGILPAACEVKLYGPGNDIIEPGAQLYRTDVTASLYAPAWNSHPVPGAIPIGTEDIWVAIAVVHTEEQQSIGCDAGPRKNDGDWLYLSTDGDWLSYKDRTGESVNWNIRLNLKD